MWEPRRPTTLWAFAACYMDSFTVPFTYDGLVIATDFAKMWKTPDLLVKQCRTYLITWMEVLHIGSLGIKYNLKRSLQNLLYLLNVQLWFWSSLTIKWTQNSLQATTKNWLKPSSHEEHFPRWFILHTDSLHLLDKYICNSQKSITAYPVFIQPPCFPQFSPTAADCFVGSRRYCDSSE
jgi:hypothetical protein